MLSQYKNTWQMIAEKTQIRQEAPAKFDDMELISTIAKIAIVLQRMNVDVLKSFEQLNSKTAYYTSL